MVRLSIRLPASGAQAQAIERALRMLMRATQLEPGCLGCQVWTAVVVDETDRIDVHYEERWYSEQAVECRVRSESFTKLLEVLEYAAAAPHVEFDFVSRHLGLEYVEAVRGKHGHA